MWKRRGSVKSFLLWALVWCLSSAALWSDVVLTDAEVAEIRTILRDTKTQAISLRISLEASQTESAELSARLAKVEWSLDETALRWERSEISLIDCLRDLDEARTSLEALKADYLALSESLTRQKRAASVWRAIALTSGVSLAVVLLYEWWR